MRGVRLSQFDTRVPRTQVSNGPIEPKSNCILRIGKFDISTNVPFDTRVPRTQVSNDLCGT